MANEGRIRQLDGLRAIAFLSVFVHHSFHAPLLWMGVDLFFVMSGFLITQILLRQRDKSLGQYFGSFYSRRARRILPPYLLFLAFATLVFHISWGKAWYWYAFFATNIAETLHRGAGEALVPLWSLAVEEQFYLVWPIVVLIVSRRALPRVLVGLLIGAPLLRLIVTPFVNAHWAIYFLTPFRMDLLAAGSLLGILWQADRNRVLGWHRKSVLVMFAMFGLVLLLSRVPSFRTGSNSILFNVFGYSISVLLFASVLVFALCQADGSWVFRILTNRLATYLGQISYMMYLVHMGMIILARTLAVNGRIPGLLVVPAALAGTIVFSACSWKFVEAPLLRGKEEKRHVAVASAVAD